MELPTYTNIWKIEKRLYKLYDFRLPMPLPVGQVAAFLAIAIPYMLILTMAGMPFSHTWVWLYVLPPGVLAWLVTRPVLEGKRLPELVLSQLRYLSEPRTWCRMAPLAEKDQMLVTARVWRRPAPSPLAAISAPAMAAPGMAGTASVAGAVEESGEVIADAGSARDANENLSPARPIWPTRPAIASSRANPALATSEQRPAQAQPARVQPAQSEWAESPSPGTAAPDRRCPVRSRGNRRSGRVGSRQPRRRASQRQPGSARPEGFR